VAGAKRRRRRQPDEFAQAAPHPVTLDSVADLLRNGKTDPWRPGLLAPANLDDKGSCVRSRAVPGGLGNGPEVTPAFQSLHVRVTDLASPNFGAIHFKQPLAIDV
jgi:hypothetical protein